MEGPLKKLATHSRNVRKQFQPTTAFTPEPNLQQFKDRPVHLSGVEVYADFCGHCLATGNAIRKGKLEIGQDNIAMAKKGKLTRAVFGANGIELCRVIEEELQLIKEENETGIERPKIEITELLPEESEKQQEQAKLDEEIREANRRLRDLTVAARKKRVNERLQVHLLHHNFILFFPHCHQAYYDLYEKWDEININVSAKEALQLNPEDLNEVLYMSDVEPNEACVYALTRGRVLVVLFKMLDSDTRDFVKLLRYVLYEEIPVPKEDAPPEKQVPPIPAFERYATISKTAREVRRERYEAKLEQKRLEKEEKERLEREQARLKRQEEEDRIREQKEKEEQERIARLAAGLPAEVEPEEVAGEQGEGEHVEAEAEPEPELDPEANREEEKVEEEKAEEEHEEEFHSDEEVEGEEYIPPGGLFVPGLYAPPNELAKNNGIVFFFPKNVQKITPIESEHLPPHILVMFTVDKRRDVMEMVSQLGDEILAKGFFFRKADEKEDPYTMDHIAYSLKQYDKMHRLRKHKDRLALMVSRKRSLPLLQLTGFNPCYISSDSTAGERDCLQLFPVGYADDFVEEESVAEEEEDETQLQDEDADKPPEEDKNQEEEEEEEDEA